MTRLIESLRRLRKNKTVAEPAYAKPQTRTFTLPEQIAENVAEAIIEGTYPPGSWIAEQDLADLFAVSRGPIREALRILEKEGLIQILPRRGTMVTQLSRQEVLDIFNIRAALLALAGRLTTEQLTPEVETELAESVSTIERFAQRHDVHEFLRFAYRATMLLARTSNNDRLYELIFSMARQTLALTRIALADKENRKAWAKNWRAVVGAIRNDDADAAAKAAHRLVRQTGASTAEHAAVSKPIVARNGQINGRKSRHAG